MGTFHDDSKGGAGAAGREERPASSASSLRVGLGLWAAALALSAGPAALGISDDRSAPPFYVASALLALAGSALVDRWAPLPDPDFAAAIDRGARVGLPPAPMGWRMAGATLLLAGLAAAGLSVYLAAGRSDPPDAFWSWLFALAALPVGLNFGVRDPLHLARPRVDAESATVVGILLLATALRMLGPDSAPSQPLAGDGGYGIAAAALAEGLLSLLLLHLTARRLFPLRVAAACLFLVAVSPWHVWLSQVEFLEMQALGAPLLLVYLLLRAVDSRRSIEYLLAGYGAGLCLTLSAGTRLACLVALLYLLQRATVERGFLRTQGPGLLIAALGASIFVAPMAALQVGESSALLAGAAGRMLPWIPAGSPPAAGDLSPDLWARALAAPGIAMATVRLRRPRYFLLAAGVWLPASFALAAVGSPTAGLWLTALPFLALSTALFLEVGWRGAVALSGAGSIAWRGTRRSC